MSQSSDGRLNDASLDNQSCFTPEMARLRYTNGVLNQVFETTMDLTHAQAQIVTELGFTVVPNGYVNGFGSYNVCLLADQAVNRYVGNGSNSYENHIPFSSHT